MKRILVVKLADLGDLLTATPSLRALRKTFPHARITALVSPHCKALLESTGLVDEVITLDKRLLSGWSGVLSPPASFSVAALAARLRRGHYDCVLILHHLTTAGGAAKYRALALAAGAPTVFGLDNGRGGFLTHRARDMGFGAKHEVEYCNDVMQLLGVVPDYGPMHFPISAEDALAVEELLPAARPRIAVHPGSGSFSLARRWPLDSYAEVVRRLVKDVDGSIVLVGGSDERELAETLADRADVAVHDVTGRTTVGQLGAVLQQCDAFVGNDSGVMHIAAAVGTPVVAVFGPSNDAAWGPWVGQERGQQAMVIRAELPCSPCFYRDHSLGTPEGCPARTCLHLVIPEQVVNAVEHILRARTPIAVHPGR